jgi:pimeloyl-ACP methyl ester carboxylesterase
MATPSVVVTTEKQKARWFIKTLLALILLVLLLVIAFYLRPTSMSQIVLRARMWSQGIQSRYVQLGPYRIHYLVAGEGRPVVLVNGLGGTSENWGDMIQELRSRGFKVYAPDMLGFGRSDKPDADYSISLQAGILKQFLESEHLNQADLVGWSMGGWIVMKYAAANPQAVHRLVLLDSAGLSYDGANVSALRPKTVDQLTHMMAILNPDPKPIPAFVARDILRVMAEQDWVIDRTLKSMFTGKDVMDNHLQELTMPVLIIWGKQDLITPFTLADKLHAHIPHSSLFVVDQCGHMAPVACQSQVVAEMAKFLR